MNRRLRDVRKAIGLNQSEFAAKLGMKQGGYSQVETGENALTEQNIKLVCLTFGVNETWLKTGAGEMFIAKDLAETPEERELLGIFRRLTAEMREFFLDMGRKLVKTGVRGAETPEAESLQNAPGGMTRPPEAPQGDKPEESTA
jgi:transcriptional regulator with XRE-family HTH domain